MISDKFCLPRFREARAWGYEVRFGPRGLEETVRKGEGMKFIPILGGADQVGNLYMNAEERMNAGRGKKLVVSTWLSTPVDFSNVLFSKDTHNLGVRLHRALRRLIRAHAKRFFKEVANEKAGKARGVETIPVKGAFPSKVPPTEDQS